MLQNDPFPVVQQRPISYEDEVKMFGSLSIIDEDGCLCLPPLDLITACSDDDASSVSSMSSYAEDFDTPPRSIFSSYWEKHGSRSSLSSLSERPSHKRRLSKDLPMFEAYEHSLSSSSFTEEEKTSGSGNRRKIFGSSGGYSFTRSEPYLAAARPESDPIVRKSRSTSAILCRPKSCLRRGRYSHKTPRDQQSRGDSSSSSVSFKTAVEVVVYQLPIEQHAQKGWSKLFV